MQLKKCGLKVRQTERNKETYLLLSKCRIDDLEKQYQYVVLSIDKFFFILSDLLRFLLGFNVSKVV